MENVKILIKVGDSVSAGDPEAPNVFSDIFTRVCGPDRIATSSVDKFIEVNTGNFIGDNFWLWRADHTESGLVMNSTCRCDNGLVVNGSDVTMYGLAIEHTLQDNLVWNGERGSVYFYQNEMPYDVTHDQWGTPGYVGYRVNDSVKSHKAYGVGIYSFFRDHTVNVESGIKVPENLVSSFVNPFSIFLNGNGTTNHIINGHGEATRRGVQKQQLCYAGLRFLRNELIE